MYDYTAYYTDGTLRNWQTKKALTLEEKQELVGGLIEPIPNVYWLFTPSGKDAWAFGHEDERFKEEYEVNPHFRDLGGGFNIVGTVILEQKI